MATEAQIRYAKNLIERADMSLNLYPLDKDTPIKAVSWLIDKLKNGQEVGPNEYEEIIKQSSGYSTQQVQKNEGGGYGRDVFDGIVAQIKSPTVRTFLVAMIKELPDYFFTVAASSTGKYHPEFTAGDGGLVRHTLAAERVADELLNDDVFTEDLPRGAADIIRADIVFHDGWKHGLTENKYTVHTHPLLPRQVYEARVKGTLGFSEEQEAFISGMFDAVESHMGPWTTNPKEETVLPRPQTPIQKFIHLCDYIASRKFLSMTF